MTEYIERRESIGYWLGEDAAGILGTVAGRYLGANPEIPFALRAFSADGILQTDEGYYDFDLARRLPEARHGEVAYACGFVWSDDERSLDAGIMPFSPVRFYLNETLLYRSGAVDEMKPDAKAVVPLLLRKGWNSLLLEMRKTEAGFGCRFGAEEGKVRILQVLAPFAERRETAGWAYSGALPQALYGEGLGVPRLRREGNGHGHRLAACARVAGSCGGAAELRAHLRRAGGCGRRLCLEQAAADRARRDQLLAGLGVRPADRLAGRAADHRAGRGGRVQARAAAGVRGGPCAGPRGDGRARLGL
ncbi:hypothetical protein OMP38_09810 [Cohnella ginsengisoli]|uniref:Uncharacterized protein n=1 Tax=Cohnella ginsengisoli TaxID=425004 RepID=A0A9X4QLS2_9BACL|nr:hypothetical protein [Cohnella ginsengisoli]MDG0791134.1 hypothetical protein [Cohnella ginsengisoli]